MMPSGENGYSDFLCVIALFKMQACSRFAGAFVVILDPGKKIKYQKLHVKGAASALITDCHPDCVSNKDICSQISQNTTLVKTGWYSQ